MFIEEKKGYNLLNSQYSLNSQCYLAGQGEDTPPPPPPRFRKGKNFHIRAS